ncbi:hypothetical protein [Pseudonocardia sp. ICBG1142]|uniref:hypothetical protein n=1 Tax=Pseudonocardia sp. ICBG1142 TaxID=2846760 RepID=UPI001CF6E402|nr:hypothetical protein [Pseudonocardia sp. ICBG1142]
MLTVTQAIFSGRADPTGEITDPKDIEKVLAEVARNRDAITTSIEKRRPDRTMLMVTTGDIDRTHGLPGEFYVDDGHALDDGASRRLASYILDTVELEVPTSQKNVAARDVVSYSTADIALRDDTGPYPRSSPVGQGRGTVQYGRYNPAWWNEYIKGNNCYAYACNVRTHGQGQLAWPHPGFCTTQKIPTSDAEFLAGLDSDGVIKISDTMEPVHGTVDDPAWLVGLCSGIPYNANGKWDYHFYRKVWSEDDQQYYWAGKPNAYPVEFIRDVDHAVEEDAKKHGYKWQGYGVIHDITVCAESVT